MHYFNQFEMDLQIDQIGKDFVNEVIKYLNSEETEEANE